MEAKNLGELIFKLRTKKGLTQFELANLLNVSDKTVSKWESGKGFPEVTQLPEIAKIFNITLDFLMIGEKSTKKETSTILMSRIEYCAKTDDPKLVKNIKLDISDEDGHNLIYYIKKYESLKVLNYLIDNDQSNLICKGMSDEEVVYYALILNRLDIVKHRFRTNDSSKIDIKQLSPFDEYKKHAGYVLTDKIFKTIVTDKRISQQTIDYLFSPISQNYWTQAFPYIIDMGYKYKKAGLLDRLLALIETDNADKTIIYQKSIDEIKRYGYNASLNRSYGLFYFGGNYGTQYCTVTRILESTIKAALEKQDYCLVDRLNKINSQLMNMGFKCFIASEYDIRMTKVLNDPKATEREKKKQSVIFDGKVDLKKLIALGDFEVYNELKDSPPIELHDISFEEIKDFEDIRFFEEMLRYAGKANLEKGLDCDSEIHRILKYVLVNYPERYDIQQLLLDNGAQLISHWTEDDGWGYDVSCSAADTVATQLLKNQLKISRDETSRQIKAR